MAATDRGIFVPADKRNVGLVFQSYAIWPHMSVEQNVAYPLTIRRRFTRREIRQKKVAAILEWVGLEAFAKRPATQLSGGQQQRVALARSLVYEPDLLLLDEPLSNLDARLRQQMRGEIAKLQQRLGISILYVTHDQAEAMALSQRIAVMHAGRIEQIGTPREIYEKPSTHFVQSFVGNAITIEGRVAQRTGTRCVELHDNSCVQLAPDSPYPEGAQVLVSFRPEHVTMESAPRAPELNEVIASIRDISYLGDRLEYTLAVGAAEFLLEAPNLHADKAGAHVLLRIDPAAVKIWPR